MSFCAGDHVTVRDESWLVLNSEAFRESHLVHLRGIGSTNHGELQSVLSPFDRVERVVPSTRIRTARRRRALATAALHIADARPWNYCWTAATANIELRSWQFEPALAALKGATRILLADHVGLGKTIQAGLIVAELLARGLATRVLVLSPSSLRTQWAHELRHRFRLAPVIFDHASLTTAVMAAPVGVNPWHTAPLIVSSIDLVKRPEVRSALDGVVFDVLVVDEAHHVTPNTDRGAVVADLASRTPWVVLVTATPHSGDDAAFQFLQHLGSNNEDELITFRRTRSPAAAGTWLRRSRTFAVSPTVGERALLDETARYVHAAIHSSGGDDGARLVASVIARRAASCARALCGTLSRRIALLSQRTTPEDQPCLPWEDADAADGDVTDALLSAPALPNVRDEVEWLRQLLGLAQAATVQPSKIALIRRLLRRTNESLLVFSEYRDVVSVIAAALADLTTVEVLHGGLSPNERQDVVRRFNQGQTRVLVATDAAGEGLNLHYRCRLVVNVELPWMPRRLEQRIGRVDRIGQTRRVHALHLVHRGSFEGTVIARLERRRALVAARTRDAAIADSATPVADERQLRGTAVAFAAAAHSDAMYTSQTTRRAPPACVVLLYGATLLDGAGRLVQRVVVPVAFDWRADRCRWRHMTRQSVRRLALDRGLRSGVESAVAEQCGRSRADIQPFAIALERRLTGCLESIEQRSKREPAWQGSLFDPQIDALAERRQAATHALAEHLGRKRDDARALARLRWSVPRLLVAWPAM